MLRPPCSQDCAVNGRRIDQLQDFSESAMSVAAAVRIFTTSGRMSPMHPWKRWKLWVDLKKQRKPNT